MPFRSAHAVVGGLVRTSLQDGTSLADLVAAHPDLGAEAAELLRPGTPVTNRTTPGGAGPAAVALQLDRAHKRVADDRARVEAAAAAGP